MREEERKKKKEREAKIAIYTTYTDEIRRSTEQKAIKNMVFPLLGTMGSNKWKLKTGQWLIEID